MILKRGTGSGERARRTGKPNPSPIINLEVFNGKTTGYFISLFSNNIHMPVTDKVRSRFAWNCDHTIKRTSRKRRSLMWRVTYQISVHTIPPIALHIGTKTYPVWWYNVNSLRCDHFFSVTLFCGSGLSGLCLPFFGCKFNHFQISWVFLLFS